MMRGRRGLNSSECPFNALDVGGGWLIGWLVGWLGGLLDLILVVSRGHGKEFRLLRLTTRRVQREFYIN